MKRTILALFLISIIAASCSRAVSPGEAASRGYKKCHPLK